MKELFLIIVILFTYSLYSKLFQMKSTTKNVRSGLDFNIGTHCKLPIQIQIIPIGWKCNPIF